MYCVCLSCALDAAVPEAQSLIPDVSDRIYIIIDQAFASQL